jgi:exodeoxyribonuclease-3
LTWLEAAQPDVVCLQEKVTDAAFPAAPIREVGYQTVWQGQASWNEWRSWRGTPNRF